MRTGTLLELLGAGLPILCGFLCELRRSPLRAQGSKAFVLTHLLVAKPKILCYFCNSLCMTSHSVAPSEKSTSRTSYLLRVVLIAFLLRVGGMVLLHSYRARLENDESVHIASALASGQGFSNPFGASTGPTAWLAPLYPFVLSRIFLLFGIQTRAAIFFALLLNCLFSALTAIPIFFISQYTFGLRIAKWSLWTWSLFPYSMYWGIRSIWDTALSTLLFTLLFWFTLNLAQSSTLKKWLLYGLLWGIAGLSNTSELAFLPFAGIWILISTGSESRFTIAARAPGVRKAQRTLNDFLT